MFILGFMDSDIQKLKEEALQKASYIFEQKVLPHFTSFNTALDIGTGNGYTSFTLAKHFNEVHSIDSDLKCIKAAEDKKSKNKITNVQFSQMDAHELKFQDEFFDVVTCRAAIHHFDNPNAVLKEVKRVLRKNGFFVIMDFCFSDKSKELLEPLSRIREDDFRRYYTFHEYCDLLDRNDLQIDTIYTYTLPRSLDEWVSVAPKNICQRIINAFLHLPPKILEELDFENSSNMMIYRIIEMVSIKIK